jgi:hypothetical protein
MSQLISKVSVEENYIARFDLIRRRLVVYMESKEALYIELAGIKNTVELAEQLRELAEALEKE